MKGQTLLKIPLENGDSYYIDSTTKDVVELKREPGKHRSYIPKDVFGRFVRSIGMQRTLSTTK